MTTRQICCIILLDILGPTKRCRMCAIDGANHQSSGEFMQSLSCLDSVCLHVLCFHENSRSWWIASTTRRPSSIADDVAHLDLLAFASKPNVVPPDDRHGSVIFVDTHQPRLATETATVQLGLFVWDKL